MWPTLLGVALVIASGCVINNIFDRDIDVKMARTAKRDLVLGKVNSDHAFVYALVMLLAGPPPCIPWSIRSRR